MSGPLIVLPPDGDPTPALRKASGAGWHPHRGLAVPEEPWDLGTARHLAVASIGSAEEAAAALLLAVRGAGLIAFVDRGAPWAAGFLADLGRIAAPAPDVADEQPDIGLSKEQCDLLDLLAAGASIASAAASLYVSLRTANRRIAAARKTLGTASTSEAVVAYSRLRERRGRP
jgi:DNA-binding NarL/FixJ family response regulator